MNWYMRRRDTRRFPKSLTRPSKNSPAIDYSPAAYNVHPLLSFIIVISSSSPSSPSSCPIRRCLYVSLVPRLHFHRHVASLSYHHHLAHIVVERICTSLYTHTQFLVAKNKLPKIRLRMSITPQTTASSSSSTPSPSSSVLSSSVPSSSRERWWRFSLIIAYSEKQHTSLYKMQCSSNILFAFFFDAEQVKIKIEQSFVVVEAD